MKASGTYRISNRARAYEACLEPSARSQRRIGRIVDSLRSQILEGGDSYRLRVRRILKDPREIYRLEIEVPELSFQRVTLLDRATLDRLLEPHEVRALVRGSILSR